MSLQNHKLDQDSRAAANERAPWPRIEDNLAEFLRVVGMVVSRASFWTVVPLVTLCAAFYFYVIADPMYVSEAVISVRHKTAVPPGVGALLGSLTGSSASSEEDAALAEYIRSHEMLAKLDKMFNLRGAYTREPWNPFVRLRDGASPEQFLKFYQGMVELDIRYDQGIVKVRVLDYNPDRAQQINRAIIAQSESFMNAQSEAMMTSSLRFARNELNAAIAAANKAPPYEREAASLRLQAAQQGLATVSSLSGQQQVFLVPISSPSLPTIATRPERLLDTIAAALLASIIYAIATLGLANIRDHKKV